MMNWKSALAIILSFSLSTPAAFASDDNALLEKTMRTAFLADLNHRVVAILDINRVHVEFLLNCLENMRESQFAEATVPADKKTFAPRTNCMHGVARIRQNTKIAYPLVRQRLLLSNLLKTGTVNDLLLDLWTALSRGQQPTPRRLVNNGSSLSREVSVTNPLESVLGEDAHKELPSVAWTPSEVQTALDVSKESNDRSGFDFNKLLKKACLAHVNEPIRTRGVYDADFCERIQLRSTENGEVYMAYNGSLDNARKVMREIDVLRVYQESALRNTQALVEKEFLANVQMNPYVGLVSSSTPSLKEVVKVFSTIRKRAVSAVDEHEKFREENHLDDPEKASEKALVSLMRFTPIAASLMKFDISGKNPNMGPGPELMAAMKLMPFSGMTVEDTFNSLLRSHNWQEMKDMAFKVAEGVAINMVVCWTLLRGGRMLFKGASKLVKVERVGEILSTGKMAAVAEAAFNPMCYALGGVFLNIWLLQEDVEEYNKIYRDVFATVEEEAMIRDVNSLKAQERTVFWSIVTVPIGNGLLKAGAPLGVGMYQFGKDQTVKLSPKLVEKAEAVSLRLAH